MPYSQSMESIRRVIEQYGNVTDEQRQQLATLDWSLFRGIIVDRREPLTNAIMETEVPEDYYILMALYNRPIPNNEEGERIAEIAVAFNQDSRRMREERERERDSQSD